MRSMDRNTVIGFVLLALLLFLYLFLSTKSTQELQLQKKKQQDSLAIVRIQDSIGRSKDTTQKPLALDTTNGLKKATGTEQLLNIENDVLKITFTNKGGQIKSVVLRNYKSAHNGKQVVLNGTPYDKISYSINTAPNQAAQISELFFSPAIIVKNSDNSQTITFQLTGAAGEQVVHQYTVRPNDYLIDWNVLMKGADKLLTQGNFNLIWQVQPIQQEKDVTYERLQSNICFYEDGDFDYIQQRTEKKFEKPVQWVSIAQQFFNTTLIAKSNFNSGEVNWVKETSDSSSLIARTTATLQSKIPLGAEASIPLQLYYGPKLLIKFLKKSNTGITINLLIGRTKA